MAHAALYAVLGLALAYGRRGAIAPPPHWLMILVGALYGASDEWHQAFVRGRSPDVGDWTADVVGVVLGYTLLLGVMGWWATSRSRDDRVDVS